jgi:hypothetical protein
VVGSLIPRQQRDELDDLRRGAIDVDHVVREREVIRALQLADSLITSVSPT